MKRRIRKCVFHSVWNYTVCWEAFYSYQHKSWGMHNIIILSYKYSLITTKVHYENMKEVIYMYVSKIQAYKKECDVYNDL